MYTMKVRSISGTVHTFSYYDREVYERCLRVAEKSEGLTVLETDEPAVETEITDGA